MSNLPGYDNLIGCPYNPSHQILPFRMQTHLVKCRQSYPNAKKVKCPFNAVHLVNEQELKVSKFLSILLNTFKCFSSFYFRYMYLIVQTELNLIVIDSKLIREVVLNRNQNNLELILHHWNLQKIGMM